MLGIIVLPQSTMVTCKETRAIIIALHKKGFPGKGIALKSRTSRRAVVKKASGRPRKSSKHQSPKVPKVS